MLKVMGASSAMTSSDIFTVCGGKAKLDAKLVVRGGIGRGKLKDFAGANWGARVGG